MQLIHSFISLLTVFETNIACKGSTQLQLTLQRTESAGLTRLLVDGNLCRNDGAIFAESLGQLLVINIFVKVFHVKIAILRDDDKINSQGSLYLVFVPHLLALGFTLTAKESLALFLLLSPTSEKNFAMNVLVVHLIHGFVGRIRVFIGNETWKS